MQKAFTLIELLVVVLIIGILSAIALPQYKIAVAKSKFASIRPLINALVSAEETYFLANGKYAYFVHELDIQWTCPNPRTNHYVCKEDFLIDPLVGDAPKITIFYCPGYAAENKCTANYEFAYTIYLNGSSSTERFQCVGTTTLGQAICVGQ